MRDVERWGREIADLVVTGTSPDKSVEVDVEGGGKIRVRLVPASFDKHTPESLSATINDTISASIAAFRYGCARIEREIFG